MKTFAPLMMVLLALVVHISAASAATSDYALIQNFKTAHKELLEAIKSADNLEQCDALAKKVDALKAEFEPHRNLLNDGVHPETFDSSIAALQSQLKIARDKNQLAVNLKTTSDQLATTSQELADIKIKYETLEKELPVLNERIQKLTEENGSLAKDIEALKGQAKKDKESIARLNEMNKKMTALNEKLKANIKDRDDLILAMMDSLFTQYSKPNLTDAQNKNLSMNVKEDDYVHKVVATINDNQRFLETASLSAQDALFMRQEQKKFAAHWEKISPHLGKLYPDQQAREKSVTMVESSLSGWKRNLDATIWKQIHQLFTRQGITIEAFGDAGEFYTRVLAYVDNELKNPSRSKFDVFNGVWMEQIKDQWMAVILADNGLTDKQRLDLEEKIALWAKKTSSNAGLWILAAGLGLIVIAVIAFLMSKGKAGKGAPARA